METAPKQNGDGALTEYPELQIESLVGPWDRLEPALKRIFEIDEVEDQSDALHVPVATEAMALEASRDSSA